MTSSTSTTTTTTATMSNSSSNPGTGTAATGNNNSSKSGIGNKILIKFEGATYDITNFQHPGGSIIRAAYHQDTTFIVHSYHPNVDVVRHALKPYKLHGQQQEADKSSNNYKAPLYEELKRRVHKALVVAGDNPGANVALRVKMLGLVACFVGCFCWLTISTSTNHIRMASIGLGASLALVGMNVVHDASHMATECGSATKWNYIWQLSGELIGLSSLGWTHLHGMQHHIQTDNLLDPDVTYIYPILRSLPEQQHYPHHYFQVLLLVPLMLMFVLVFQTFVALFVVRGTYNAIDIGDNDNDIKENAEKEKEKQTQQLLMWRNQHNIREWLQFFLAKFCLLGQWGMLYYKGGLEAWLLCVTTSSFIFASIDVPGHTTTHPPLVAQDKLPPSCRRSEDESGGDLVDCWLLQQLHNTNSFDPHLNGLLGGLNLQIEHHLFPRISHRHYPTIIRPILQEFCYQHNLPYNDYSLVTATIGTILRFVQLSFPSSPKPPKQQQKKNTKVL